MTNFRVSSFLHFQPVDSDNDISVGWNRFYPTVFILNRRAKEIIKSPLTIREIDREGENGDFFRQLIKYKFIYTSSKDHSKPDFLKMIDLQLTHVKEKGIHFYQSGDNYYDEMEIFTDECNLVCPYCVNQYKRRYRSVETAPSRRLEIVNRCIDQYIERYPARTSTPVKIFFNGGEILLKWKIVRAIVNRLQDKYKGLTFAYELNTNLTPLTEEIAEFLGDHNFKVHISIDGYGEAHDSTRRYHSGKGSFADIMKKLEIYRKFNPDSPINTFQGTIHSADGFNASAVYEMEQYGFTTARLAPNLLAVSEEDAQQKAVLMEKLLTLNGSHRLQVTELFFANAKEKINRDEYRFTMNCRGLSCLPQPTLRLNISTLRVSQLCSYVPAGYLSLRELGYDIYHPKLWKSSLCFIRKRLEAVKRYCLDCHLVGLCSGGCIYTGLDNENKPNKAACVFQKKLWSLYIKKSYLDQKSDDNQ